jgi:hypothetical protein
VIHDPSFANAAGGRGKLGHHADAARRSERDRPHRVSLAAPKPRARSERGEGRSVVIQMESKDPASLRLLNRRSVHCAEVGSNGRHSADEDAQGPHDDGQICDDQGNA